MDTVKAERISTDTSHTSTTAPTSSTPVSKGGVPSRGESFEWQTPGSLVDPSEPSPTNHSATPTFSSTDKRVHPLSACSATTAVCTPAPVPSEREKTVKERQLEDVAYTVDYHAPNWSLNDFDIGRKLVRHGVSEVV
eukprot:GHVN01084504.1.p1 GENE.GHVN01084504.1~~GHVN01084504.1.p1  ORF type:complete len:137 (+),score=46.15 GHVN01084504.1:251-661(+)